MYLTRVVAMKANSKVKGRKPLTAEAAKAYDNTVREYHKEFQKVNIND